MALRIWTFFCATLVAGGWLLSLASELNPVGYLVVIFLFGVGCLSTAKIWRNGETFHLERKLDRLISWRRVLPALFAGLALILLCRGIFLPPFHGDGLSYRIPRTLNWLFEERWYWIDAQDPRLNTRGTVSEWLTAPLLLFFKWDHLVFLPNWICFLFFPGLVFRVWREWGVPSRTAWVWMWLLPAGFCYALQACNCSTDILAAFFALASFAFLRRTSTAPPVDVVCSVLCIALATGVKLTMAPMVAPWAILAFSRLRLARQQPYLTALVLAWGALVSALPIITANYCHVGEPTGLSLEPLVLKHAPIVDRLVGNTIVIIMDNLTYPDLAQNYSFRSTLENSTVGKMIALQFETDILYLYPYWSVEQEGLGPLVLLAGVCLLAATFAPGYLLRFQRRLTPTRLWLHLAMIFLFVAFMGTGTSVQPARLVSGFYPYLLSTFFVGSGFVSGWRKYLPKALASLALLTVIGCVLWSTDFPLISDGPSFHAGDDFEKAQVSYLGHCIPPTEEAIGLMRFWNQWESWAWKPYGSRRVYELPENPERDDLVRKQIHYIVIMEEFLNSKKETIHDWTAAHHAVVAGGLVTGGRFPAGYYVVYIGGAPQGR